MRVGCAVFGSETSGANLSPRPAVNDAFAWYIRCSGTGAGQLQAGWRRPGSNTWVEATATLTSFTPTSLNVVSLSFVSYYLDGDLWNVKCWDRALTNTEILKESNCRGVESPLSLNFHWPLDTAAQLGDSSKNQRNPTIGGTLTTSKGLNDNWRIKPRRVYKAPAAGGIEARTLSASGAGVFSPLAASIAAVTLPSSGVGTASFDSAAFVPASLSATGAGVATFGAASVYAQSLSAAGAGAATWQSAAIQAAALASSGVGAATFNSAALALSSLLSDGVGTASYSSVAFNAQALSAAGVAAVSWIGEDANSGLAARTLSASGAGVATFEAVAYWASDLAAAGVGGFAPQSAQLEPRTLGSAGVAAAAFDGADGNATTIEARTLAADGIASAIFVGVDAAAPVSLGGKKRRRMLDDVLPPQIHAAALWTGGRSSATFDGIALRRAAEVRASAMRCAASSNADFHGMPMHMIEIDPRTGLARTARVQRLVPK